VILAPNKQTNYPKAIAGSDALFILQYLAFLVAMTNDNKLAADVTDDGKVTGSDVLAILRYLAFYSDNIGTTGQWRFQSQDSSFTLNSNMTIDFKAYLSGDANLDWKGESGAGQAMAKAALYSNISLELDHDVAPQGEYVEIPLRMATHDEMMNTLQFSVEYDAECLRFQSVKPTPVTEKFLIQVNSSEAGKVHVAMAGIEGINSQSQILLLRFEVLASSKQKQSTQLILVRALANDRIVKTIPGGEVRFTDTKSKIIPGNFALFHNYPNPFNSSTQIEFQLPQSAHVSIKIYNLRGNEIRTILNENKPAGSYRITWDGKNNHGTAMPSGIYMLQLKSNGYVQSKKMIMMK
jgi:flagellar hook assembly protein FlgD